MRTKHTFRLPPDLAGKLADHASRKRVPQALVVETALASFLSPDSSERMEAALGRRLDRLTRQVERLERHITISNEALALFVRFWLTATPPLPDTAQPAAQTKGRERYEGFVEALGRRLARGQTLAQEISLARTLGLLFLLIPVVEPVCGRRVGGDGGSSFLSVRDGIAWRAHVTHRARTIDRGLA
jgi:predicted transcriptional regulator